MIKDSYPMNIGGELIRNELKLLTRMEQGNLMGGSNSVRFLVLHCSATRCNQSYTVEQMKKDHKSRGFMTIGYHFYIRRDGTMTQHRRLLEVGAHARPYNRCSIGICYEGGLDANGKPADTVPRHKTSPWRNSSRASAPTILTPRSSAIVTSLACARNALASTPRNGSKTSNSIFSRRKLHPTTSLAPFFGARDFCFKIIKKAKNKSKSIEISYT